MIYHRDTLKALAGFASTDPTRPALQGIRIMADKAAACDGHILLEIERGTQSVDDAPASLLNGAAIADHPITVPAKAVLDACKATPKRGGLPILECVAFSNGTPDRVGVHATDLETVHSATVADLGTYPDYPQAFPKGDPAVTIGVTVDVILQAFKALKAAGVEGVALEIRDPNKGIVFTGRTREYAALRGIIMPRRI